MNNENEILNNEVRYIFNNWSEEDFTGYWNSKPQLIKAGETVELPKYLALHYCKHFVNREMDRDNKSSSWGIEEARKPYIVKTITEITGNTDSPALASLKNMIRKEVEEEKVSTGSEMKSGDVSVDIDSIKKVGKKTQTKEFGGLVSKDK